VPTHPIEVGPAGLIQFLAARYIPSERLGSTDDCGFSPFSIDLKPKHGSTDTARDIAFQKIKSRVEGTRMASEKLGVS